MSNLEIIKRLYRAIGEKDFPAFKAQCNADLEWRQNPGFPGGGHHFGAEAVIENVLRKLAANWTGWRFDVLRYLIRHHERVVPKVELLANLWAYEVVSESVLPTNIAAVR